MVQIHRSRKFEKQYKQLDRKIQQKVEDRVNIFIINPFDSVLKTHRLVGQLSGKWSLNVTADYRVIFSYDLDGIFLEAVGTHSQLYG
ncbi:MAG TPA: type II toxin-antitoxin system mRNA interferase toxin, RelE/StbE family [Acidimicrobiia bacterium]|nr:type II toxin-antitoxin system mRNA interferase toxin, RelE/StbE family [Acidimicrobiia bacterium]